jgi:ectoine hydroxylase-related dioxygenase (phytanoyl-CoA dioxygenase family)
MNTYIKVTIVFIILCIIISIFTRQYQALSEISDLNTHGYIVKHDVLKDYELKKIQDQWNYREYKDIYMYLKYNKDLLEIIRNTLGENYVIMDYIMYLSNSVLHTCHRDNNGSRFNDIKHKSYTMLIYIDDLKECLDVVPESHKHIGVYSTDQTMTFMCKPGSIIIFDSDLVHSGGLSEDVNNRRIQMKITHRDDYQKLNFYDNYFKIVNKPNKNSEFSKKIQKHLTCQFPIFSDLTQGNNKEYISGEISDLGKVFSHYFYSDKDFYKLEDAF